MKSLLAVVRLSSEYLEKKGIEHPRREAEDLVGHALGLKRLDLYVTHDRPLIEEELDRCRALLRRRAEGEPTAYIVGSLPFHGCTLRITPDVLIPRPETEILVALVVERLRESSLEDKQLWDLCTGSGCIAIALKKRFPALTVIASDISSQALALAKENAERNSVAVDFRQGDLLLPFLGRKAHFLTCNPPYVAEDEWASLDAEVRLREPKEALVSGPTGLEVYERLASELPEYLYPGGRVWMEIGYQQGGDVRALFQPPHWCSPDIVQDWAGHDRFLVAQLGVHPVGNSLEPLSM